MRSAILAGTFLLVIGGCASTSPTSVLRTSKRVDVARVSRADHREARQGDLEICTAPAAGLSSRPTNLLLGRSADLVRMTRQFAYRSDWPSADLGYRFNDVTYYTDITFDDQAFFDSLGGTYYRFGEQVRTGGLMRE